MATSHRKSRRAFKALVAAFAIFATAGALAQSPPREGDITLDAASSEVDYRSNTLLFRDVIITQGDARVAAQRARATGLDFDDATWTLSGVVRINVDGGELRSDEATVTFERNRIVRASIRGQQAEFSQQLKGGGTARGRAGSIVYEMGAGTVTLREDAWLSDDGRSEIRGEQLVYNVREQRVQAGKPAGSSERVRIIIRPSVTRPSADGASKP
jgi:lipopolysaccharide transport protein LptA